MAFQVMHADRGDPQRRRQRIGEAGADQQRAGQPRPLRVGDRSQRRQAQPGFGQHPPGQRYHPPDVVARRQFRHDAAVFGVHRHLGMHCLRQQAPLGVV